MTEGHRSLDAYAPVDMAARVEAGGVAKATLDTATILALAVLAGAFIALGANFATIVLTDTGVGYGLLRLAGGLVFSVGRQGSAAGASQAFATTAPSSALPRSAPARRSLALPPLAPG
jgi:hypothetical protein